MRDIIIAGNWKMNKDAGETAQFCSALKGRLADVTIPGLRVIVAPAFVLLPAAKQALAGSRIEASAQDVSSQAKGAFTGEVSAPMLASLQVSYAIVGHSERRQYHAESNELVRNKVQMLLDHRIIPIMCIGETLDQREAGETEAVLESQLSGCFDGIELSTGKELVIAYEPVWAIGTGKTATSEQAQQAHAFIRNWLNNRFGSQIAQNMSILYGGSMKPGNCEELISQPDIDGGLIGGASLKIDDFADMVHTGVSVLKKGK